MYDELDPYIALWVAVIERARLDAAGQFGRKVAHRKATQREAAEWLRNDLPELLGMGPGVVERMPCSVSPTQKGGG